MISISSTQPKSQHFIHLQKWFESEWQKPYIVEKGIPHPLIALSDGVLVGGLAFTFYSHPEKDEMALWINALYVEPKYRGMGIASRIIKAAEEACDRTELFAFTDVPDLYEKLGWQKLKAESENVVLWKSLAN